MVGDDEAQEGEEAEVEDVVARAGGAGDGGVEEVDAGGEGREADLEGRGGHGIDKGDKKIKDSALLIEG